jgi:hypothetical protein
MAIFVVIVALIILLQVVFNIAEKESNPVLKLRRDLEKEVLTCRPMVDKVESRYYGGSSYILDMKDGRFVDVDIYVKDSATRLMNHLQRVDTGHKYEVRLDCIDITGSNNYQARELFYFIENLYKEQQK